MKKSVKKRNGEIANCNLEEKISQKLKGAYFGEIGDAIEIMKRSKSVKHVNHKNNQILTYIRFSE